MLWFFYDVLLGLVSLFVVPKLLWDRVFQGKYKQCLAAYFSLNLPKISLKKGPVFLIYAVSMGETKAAASLFQKIKASYPNATIYIASRTETGQAEAKKSLNKADGYFFLPFDFSFVVNRFLKHLKPDYVLIIESDFWPNFLRMSKKGGAQVFLVSGKISLRSFQRFHKVYYLIKRILSFFDCICVQNALYQERFIGLGAEASLVLNTGNLKFDNPFVRSDQAFLKKKLGIQEGDLVLVVASTHDPEEKEVLEALAPLWDQFPQLKILFVPRHPERFLLVQEMFLQTNIPFITYSQIDRKTGLERLFLIDEMGMLLNLYQLATCAIVGGSFEKRLKGHNIFEPIQAGTPLLFGPFMSDQKDLVECVLSSQAGLQVDLKDLYAKVLSLLKNPSVIEEMKKKGGDLLIQMEGSSTRTWEPLFAKIEASKKNFPIL